MWPIPRIVDESIACIFTPRYISISYLAPTQAGVYLKAYTRIPFISAELEHSIICNSTYIKKSINTFLKKHNAQHATAHFALCGPTIREKVTNKKTSISAADHSSYLYKLDGKEFHYTVSINQAVVMQYQLLAMATGLYLDTITTPFIAQLKLYQTLHGSSFAYTQLAQDLRLHHHRIENIFDDDVIARTLSMPKNLILNLANERSFLLSSLGIFYLRRQQ